jgi:hypothetical protein
MKPLRLLHLEGTEDDALLVQRRLALHYALTCKRVQDASAMRSALESSTWDVILSDWSMPQFTALDAIGVLKQ